MTATVTASPYPQPGTEEYLVWMARRRSLIRLLYNQGLSVRSIAFELTKEGYRLVSSARIYEILKQMFRTGAVVKKHRYGGDKEAIK